MTTPRSRTRIAPVHTFQGLCPDSTQPEAFDPECPRCRFESALILVYRKALRLAGVIESAVRNRGQVCGSEIALVDAVKRAQREDALARLSTDRPARRRSGTRR